MTPAEIKLCRFLLRLAAESFSHRSCSDLDLVREAGLTLEESLEVLRGLYAWRGRDLCDEDPVLGDSRTFDYWVMEYLAARMDTPEGISGNGGG